MKPCSTTEINPLPFTHNQNIAWDYANPSSMGEDQDSYLQYCFFPDPFLDDDHDLFLSHFFQQQQQHHLLIPAGNANWDQQEREREQEKLTPDDNRKKQNSGKTKKLCSRKIGKKDRHSKICTAQGPRDRRMRLSLQIARKFFDLQDMLGFDKASNTIDWLLSHSNSAIKKLKDSLNLNNNNHSAYSYGSQVSCGSSEAVSELTTRDNNVASGKESAFMATPTPSSKLKKGRQLRTVARESRDRARARARERTKEKLILKSASTSTISDHPQHFPSILQTLCSGNSDHHHHPTPNFLP